VKLANRFTVSQLHGSYSRLQRSTNILPCGTTSENGQVEND